MFEKNGKYFAGWRDASGKRLRKSFTSRRAALVFEEEQKEIAHPKRMPRGQRLPHSYSPKKRAALLPIDTKQERSSPLSRVHSSPRSSARPTSSKSTSASKLVAMPTRRK